MIEATIANPAAPRVIALKPYDVRHERELGRHRHLRQATRRVLRVSSLVVLDALTGATALAAAVVLIPGLTATWSQVAFPIISVFVLSLMVAGANGAGSGRRDAMARLRGVLLSMCVLFLGIYLPPQLPLSVGLIGCFGVLAYIGVEAERHAVQSVVLRLRRDGHLLRPTLIVGSEAERRLVERELRELPDSDLIVVGRVATEGLRHAGGMLVSSDLEAMIHEHDVQAVILGESVPPATLSNVVARAFDAGCSVIGWPSGSRAAIAALSVAPLFDPAVLEVHPPRLRLPQLELKRTIDALGSGLALLLLSPLLVMVVIAIKIDSSGPVFFKQTRLGVGGRAFRLWKFRTMVPDAEEQKAGLAHLNLYEDSRLFKIEDDPRITRIGRLLRRTSIDELPQLFNVLKGDMSLVGPRPPLPQEVIAYAEDHLVRLTVVPGLTGPWQANGRNSIRSFEEVVRLEREYIRDWSLALDLRIIARTLLAVLRGSGAH